MRLLQHAMHRVYAATFAETSAEADTCPAAIAYAPPRKASILQHIHANLQFLFLHLEGFLRVPLHAFCQLQKEG